MAKTIKKYGKITLILGLILVLLGMYLATPFSQAAINNREMKLSDSRPGSAGGTNVTYDFEGDHSGSSVKCLEVQFCTNASGNCTLSDIDLSSATKGASGDWAGWTYANWLTDGSSFDNTNKRVRYYNTSGQAGAADRSFSTDGVTNPSAGTRYAWVKTYSPGSCTGTADCCAGSYVDFGIAAFAIIAGVGVSANVKESLTFAITDSAIGFGTWNTTEVRWATGNENGDTSEPVGAGEATQLSVTTNTGGTTTIYIRDEGSGSAAGLYKASPAKLIPAVGVTTTVPTANNEQYGAYGNNASNLIVDEGFDGDDTGAVILSRSPLAFATGSGALNAATVDLKLKAAITGTTPGGAYADTIILIVTPTY